MHFNYKNSYRATISIIGASEIDKKTEILVIELGRLLAKNNYAVACGGLSGVMEAICKGVKEEGGLTIGIIPFKEKAAANEYVDIIIPVPFSQARNIVVVLSGDACVAIAGKAGTLSEMCFAWIYEKPLIALSSVEGWSSKLANQKLDDRRSDMIYGVETPQMVIKKLNEFFKD
ncbi:MAG: TIGR00725 family protein [Candidatus Hodarchaeota archaeon]